MKIAIMQPYFMPYIGYFQLINSVDKFIIYDNIQYIKGGWINRNRILSNGNDKIFTVPLKKGSNYLNVVDRFLSDSYEKDKVKILNVIKSTYKKSPYFEEIYELILKCFNSKKNNLFEFVLESIKIINNYLNIKTPIVISSSIEIDHSLKSQNKVISICKNQKGSVYINPIGGIDLYDKIVFEQNGIDLKFIKSNLIEYKQFDNQFIPWLSIIDVLMFNSKEQIKNYLNNYILI